MSGLTPDELKRRIDSLQENLLIKQTEMDDVILSIHAKSEELVAIRESMKTMDSRLMILRGKLYLAEEGIRKTI